MSTPATTGARLKEALAYLKRTQRITQANLAMEMKRSPSNISEMTNDRQLPGKSFLQALQEKYGINTDWILNGRGEMVQKLPSDMAEPTTVLPRSNATMVDDTFLGTHQTKSGNKFIELAGGKKLMIVKRVPVKAHASYLVGWGDDEYIESLPDHTVTVDEFHKGKYRAFDVSGDSMDDDSKRSIADGDLATGRQISRSLWRSKFHTKKFPFYMIVHRIAGVMCKEIINHDTDSGTITCHSLNPDKKQHPDFVLNLDDVMEIYNIVKVERDLT